MWLVGVVIRRYIGILIIIINFPYSTCIRSFFGSSILTFCSFLNVFSVFEKYVRANALKTLHKGVNGLKFISGI